MPNPKRRSDPRYRAGRVGQALEARKAYVYATETMCAAKVCKCPTGRRVNMALPYQDPRTGRVNKWSKSFGHRQELDRPTTDPLDGHLEHLGCNISAGAAYGNRKRAGTLNEVDTSYDWGR